ncbi:Dual specificity protein kinase lkh1 [Choanephora cucurbitarum]|uniref:Dual specificity protein kinase lkh1 n=1 Tax=Choanephora cucurbitarum TaxID=101091 RepID=A0A1C7NBQ9_9FUNG|nr:Dual specificity protein kinase lkh1 [Choanephora cucurbitarum]
MTSEVKKDWKADFYKNGIPKEVIVIEDTPPPSTTNTPSIPNTSYRVEQANTDYPVGPPATSTRSKRTRREQEQEVNQIYSIVKRRKKDVPLLTQQLQASTSSVLRRPNNTIPTPLAVPLPPVPCDDKDGHYIIKPNESLTPRYKMMRLLGQGTFGKVVECYDRVKRTYCAIKIIRAIPKYRDASKIEIRVLNSLKEHDPINLNKCIHLIEWFDYHNHICMVFELLGQSVFDFLKFNEFRPFPIHHIQQFAKQILTSVAFVHELKLIHTDLKPENILLVDNRSREAGNIVDIDPTSKILENTDIRLIDFGSATFERDYHSSVVSTRHYRAPEIILGMGWSYPCDIWSIGCILVEFLTGEALFQTHDNLEHLAMMVVVLGKIPPKLVKASSREAQKFFKNGKLKYPDVDTTEQSKKYVRALKLLKRIVNPTTNAKYQFLDLLTKMLVYDPDARITAREALRHPFFMINFDEFGRETEEY